VSILNVGAQKIRTDTAGFTGGAMHEPTSGTAKTPTEYLAHVPAEFGEITHLFGGLSGDLAPVQFAPVNTSVTTTAAKPGLLGGLSGLRPPTLQTAEVAAERASTDVKPYVEPLSVSVKNTFNKARKLLGF
jgi:hypothetical protein